MANQIIARQPVKTRSGRWANNIPPHDVDWRQKFLSIEFEYNQRFQKIRDLRRNVYEGMVDQYNCKHDNTEIRKKVYSNGNVHYVLQCLLCGARSGQSIRKDTINYDPPEWDSSVEEEQARRQAEWDKSNGNRENYLLRLNEWRERNWWNIYNSYLGSPSWRWIRARVMERDEYLCQGCGINQASEVHHISYKNVGAELLFELVSVCSECHKRAHNDS